MFGIKKTIVKIILLLLLLLAVFACASISYPPPLPANLEVLPPSKDVLPEIAAFSGSWKGRWGGSIMADTIVVIEKIDNKTAEVLFSIGGNEPGHFSFTADVHPGPVLKWVIPKFPELEGKTKLECPCTMTYRLNNDLTSLIGYWEFNVYNFKVRGDLIKL